MIRPTPVTLALLASLGGCSQGPIGNSSSPLDTGFRTSFRANFVAKCEAGARTASHLSKDFGVVCGCVADRLIATKSAIELLKGPPEAETKRLAVTCLSEHPIS